MAMRGLYFVAGVALALGTIAWKVSAQTAAQPWVPAKSIDFSPQHNVLILNFDGSLSPMDQPWFQAKQVAPGTWQILSDGDYMYLVEGDTEALLIDSGYGAGNIREFAQGLTKKPLRFVANTHLHFDHTANDGYFDRAYMSEGTKAGLPTGTNPTFGAIQFPMGFPVEVVGDGYKFQLGNRELEVILLGNHTVGGTAYLDRRNRILFAGDEIMGRQGIAINVSVAQFAKLMEKLAAFRKEYDTLCAGWEMLDASWVDKYLAVAQHILAGNEGLPVEQAPLLLPVGWPAGLTPTDPAGRTIYFRHVPHGAGSTPPGGLPRAPGGRGRGADGGGRGQAGQGRGAQNTENFHRITFEGATVTYDIRNVK